MKESKRARLEAAGWTIGDASDFLGLSQEEREFIDMKLALARFLRTLRISKRWTQTQVANRLDSSQSRVAKMEAGDASVSVDLLIRSLFSLGASRGQLAEAIGSASTAPPSRRRRTGT